MQMTRMNDAADAVGLTVKTATILVMTKAGTISDLTVRCTKMQAEESKR